MLALLPFGMMDVVGATGRAAGRLDITDFHAFYLVGRSILSGHAADIYDLRHIVPARGSAGRAPRVHAVVLPATFGLVVACVAQLPLAVAYLAFTAGTLALYMWATARLAGDARWPVMLASTVSIVLNLRCGQNGLLTAAMVAAGSAALLESARCDPASGSAAWSSSLIS